MDLMNKISNVPQFPKTININMVTHSEEFIKISQLQDMLALTSNSYHLLRNTIVDSYNK